MDSTYKGPERRRSTRIDVRFIVTYQVNQPIEVRMWIGNKQVNALMLDLSEHGMAILTKHEIPSSTILGIKFTLINLDIDKDQQMRSIETIGEVRYSSLQEKEHRLGISFTRITDEDRSAIASFVKTAMNQ